MKVQKSLYNSHIVPWVLLPLRLFLGITFVYAGIQKFTDPQFFHPGAIGFIGKQMASFAKGSPIGGFLLNVAAPNALLFGYMARLSIFLWRRYCFRLQLVDYVTQWSPQYRSAYARRISYSPFPAALFARETGRPGLGDVFHPWHDATPTRAAP